MKALLLAAVLLGSIPAESPPPAPASEPIVDYCTFGFGEWDPSTGPLSSTMATLLKECLLSVLNKMDVPEIEWLRRELESGRIEIYVVNTPDPRNDILVVSNRLATPRIVLFIEADWLVKSVTTKSSIIQLAMRETANKVILYLGEDVPICGDE